LLGEKSDEYPVVDLCIDHHGTNISFANITYVESTAASACEIIFNLIVEMCGDISDAQANSIYTGMATDTGCFKSSNVTAQTHIIAAQLMAKNIDCAKINRIVFADTKTKALLSATVLSRAQFFFNDIVAIQSADMNVVDEIGACDDDVCALCSSLQDIDCVLLGITIREIGEKSYKLSVRSKPPLSAAKFCTAFGGGGHESAAGCHIHGEYCDVYLRVFQEAKKICQEAGLIKEEPI
jgi:phosphoesterase RecJ-like protein